MLIVPAFFVVDTFACEKINYPLLPLPQYSFQKKTNKIFFVIPPGKAAINHTYSLPQHQVQ